jgi:glycosyltransferase involved in cell wall biosynthesis
MTAAGRAPLSAVVTTLDNAATLDECLRSLAFCDEIVLLDSGSRDETVAIAQRRGARIYTEPFKGYGPQKQSAVDKATHDWVLLLDADEQLADGAQASIERALAAPRAEGYRLARREWLFWRWPHPATRPNWHLRLFRRSRGALNGARGAFMANPAPARPAPPARCFRRPRARTARRRTTQAAAGTRHPRPSNRRPGWC